MQNTRNRTIDIAKGLGIILVVLGHNWMVSHGSREAFRIIFSFHMPLFLFLSGIFLNERNTLTQFSMSRMHSLLKPYFTTLLFLGLIKLSSDLANKRDFLFNFYNYMEGVLYGTGRTIAWPPLWYLPHLFIVSCIALLMVKFVASDNLKWLILAISLGAGVSNINSTELPWSIDLLPISLAFFMSGYLFSYTIKTMEFDAKYSILSIALFLALHYYFNDTIDLNLRIYDNLIISTFQAILGIYICLSVASYLTQYVLAGKFFGYIGSGTLFILLFHAYFQDKTFGLLAKLMGESTLTAIFSFAAAVSLPLLLWECVKRSVLLSTLFLPKTSTYRLSGV